MLVVSTEKVEDFVIELFPQDNVLNEVVIKKKKEK